MFYDKRIGRFFVFEKVKEGFTVFPVSMSKEHLLFMLNYDGFRHMEDVLLAEQYAKLPRWTRYPILNATFRSTVKIYYKIYFCKYYS